MSMLTNLQTNLSNVSILLEKNAPTILTVLGSVSVVTGAIFVGKQTVKAIDIVEEFKETQETIEEAHEVALAGEEKIEYSEEDYKKDKIALYLQTATKMAKCYALPVGLIAGGLTAIAVSDVKVNGRLAEMTGAYVGSQQIAKRVKKAIIDKYGEDVWNEVRYGIKKEQITVEEEDPETGKKKKVKKEIRTIDSDNPLENISKFAKFFDEGCAEWDKNPEMNLLYLLSMQNTANEMLKCRGHLFLNEVYDMLGIPRTKDGQKYGWIFCDNNPCGDNYVDFGIYDLSRSKNREFVNGLENVILLDFNVDGPIIDLI